MEQDMEFMEDRQPHEINRKARQGISGSSLKLVAVATMFIDHFAAAVLLRLMISGRGRGLYETYYIMRGIGRIAFPIYCFMLIEGLEHTRNKWKYAMRLGIFALVSEVPFDLAFHSRLLEFTYQNVYFTLFFGLIMLICMQKAENRVWVQENAFADHVVKAGFTGALLLLGGAAAYFVRTDYGWRGILCIWLLYLLRGNRWMQLAAVYAAFGVLLGEWVAVPAFLLLAFYKGKKGFSAKYFFYGFYPVHLLFLYAMCCFMHIAQYAPL